MSAGAGPLRTFFWVTLPVLRPGILVGALFAFLHSFNEAVVAIFIAGRDASTLPKKMFESIRLESDPVIAVVSTLLTGAVLRRRARLVVLPSKARRSAMRIETSRQAPLGRHRRRHRPRQPGALADRVAGRDRLHRRDLSGQSEIPDRSQSRLLSEPDRPAGGARRGRLQHPQPADPRADPARRRNAARAPPSSTTAALPSSARTARGCRTRSPASAARPACRSAVPTAWASSIRPRASPPTSRR